MNDNTQLVQVGYFKPILDVLEQSGVETERLLHDNRLHKFNLESDENYVPIASMYYWLHDVCVSEGIDDFFDCFASQLKMQNLCNWGQAIAFSPDVLSACRFAVKYESKVVSTERMSLEINGPRAKLSVRFSDQPMPGQDFAEYISFSYLLNGFRLAAGDNWAPLEIHLQSKVAPNLDYMLPSGNSTRVLLGQPARAIVFPTEMFAMPMLNSETNPVTSQDMNSPQGLIQVVEELLNSSQTGNVPNMDFIGLVLDISPRTLRRQLVKHDTSYSRIIENWRLKMALSMLRQGDSQIKDVGERLGYANTANFIRAFKNRVGCTPGNYRDYL